MSSILVPQIPPLIYHEQFVSCLLSHSKDYSTMAANKCPFIQESSSEILSAFRLISKLHFASKEAEANMRAICSAVEATLAIILLVKKCECVALYHRPCAFAVRSDAVK